MRELKLSGPVTMRTARAHLSVLGRSVADEDLVVDLSAVTEADSAALALLFEGVRRARGAGRQIWLWALPEGLRSLSALYGVTELLPPQADRSEPR